MKDKKNLQYISLQEASNSCEYSQAYLSLRARQGKLKAVKLGRNWVTTEGWVKEYVDAMSAIAGVGSVKHSQATREDTRKTQHVSKASITSSTSARYSPEGFMSTLVNGFNLIYHPFHNAFKVVYFFVSSALTNFIFSLKGLKHVPVRAVVATLMIGIFFLSGTSFAHNLASNINDPEKAINATVDSLEEIYNDIKDEIDIAITSDLQLARTATDTLSKEAEQLYEDAENFSNSKKESVRNILVYASNIVTDKEAIVELVEGSKNNISNTVKEAKTNSRSLTASILNPLKSSYQKTWNWIFGEDDVVVEEVEESVVEEDKSYSTNQSDPTDQPEDPTSVIASDPPAGGVQSNPVQSQPSSAPLTEVTKVTEVTEVTNVTNVINEVISEADLTSLLSRLSNAESRINQISNNQGFVQTPQIQTPRLYNTINDNIYLTARGSGSIFLSSTTGVQISGDQIILDPKGEGSVAPNVLIKDTLLMEGNITQVGTTATSSFEGNVNATNGLDVTGADLTVGGTNFTVDSSGNLAVGGNLTVTGTQTYTGGSTFSTATMDTLIVTGNSTLGNASTDSTTIRGLLTLTDATTTTDALLFGTDAQLYRSTTNTLRTPDNFMVDSNLSVGATTTDAKLQVLSTTEQLRLNYDASNYSSFTVNSSGDLTIAPTGLDTNITGAFTTTGNTTFGDASTDTLAFNAAAITSNSATTWALKNVANALNFDSNTLTIDALNNRVGVGTATPTERFEIKGAGLTSGTSALRIINSNLAEQFDFRDDGSLSISGAGNTHRFNLRSSSTQGTDVMLVKAEEASSAGMNIVFDRGKNQSATYDNDGLTNVLFRGNNSLGGTVDYATISSKIISATPVSESGQLSFSTKNATDLLTLNDTNIGINDSTPSFTLDVNGTLRTTGNTTIGDASTDTLSFNAAAITSNSATTWALKNSTDALNFDSSTLSIDALNNRIGVGKTAPAGTLDVAGTILTQPATDTVLLLHGDGTDTSTTFVDSSLTPHTVTAVADAQIDTAQSKFGGASMLFDGTGDYLTILDSTDWTLGSDPFTIEAWVRINTLGQYHGIVVQADGGSANAAWGLDILSDNTVRGYTYDSSSVLKSVISTTLMDADVWHHIAMTREGNDLKLWFDGINEATTGMGSYTVRDSTLAVNIGRQLGVDDTDGHIDELRITKGTARWTSNFSVPQRPYDTIGNDFFAVQDKLNSAIFTNNAINVGIGTASPQSTLDVQAAAGAPGILTLATQELTVVDGDKLGRINFNSPLESDGTDAILVGASIWAEADATFSASVNSTELVFATGTSEAAAEQMRIDSAGNVGINTTTPSFTLDVNGTLRTTGNTTFGDASTDTLQFNTGVWTSASATTWALASATAALNIDSGTLVIDSSNNRLGIGTTGPDRRLDVLDAANPQLRLTNTDGSIYTDFQVAASTGDLTVGLNGANANDILLTMPGGSTGANLWVCEGTACPAVTLTDGGNVVIEGDIKYPSTGTDSVKRSIILTAAGAVTPVTSGAAKTQVEGTNHSYYVLDFDTTADESVFWHWTMPDSYATDDSAIDVTYYWEAAAISGDVTWCFQANGVAVNNADDIDGTLATAECATDTAQGNANDLASITESAAVSGFKPGEYVAFRVYRDVDNGDDMSGDARLVKVKIEYSVDAESD